MKTRIVQVACLVAVPAAVLMIGQHITTPTSAMQAPGQMRVYTGISDPSNPLDDPAFRARRNRMLNIQRQKQMESDTQKLLVLSQQFHDQVMKQTTSDLTPLQVDQLNRIEKLAHNVRERMIDTEGDPGPIFRDPFEHPNP